MPNFSDIWLFRKPSYKTCTTLPFPHHIKKDIVDIVPYLVPAYFQINIEKKNK